MGVYKQGLKRQELEGEERSGQGSQWKEEEMEEEELIPRSFLWPSCILLLVPRRFSGLEIHLLIHYLSWKNRDSCQVFLS